MSLPFQNLRELRLSRQDDLDKLFPVCLQVRYQPDLLEHGCFQILRFIDDEDDGAALGILLEKKLVEAIQGAQAIGGGWNAEFPVNVLKKLGCREAGIKDQGCPVMIWVKLAEQCTQDRCFP